jgi:hypothetical protein
MDISWTGHPVMMSVSWNDNAAVLTSPFPTIQLDLSRISLHVLRLLLLRQVLRLFNPAFAAFCLHPLSQGLLSVTNSVLTAPSVRGIIREFSSRNVFFLSFLVSLGVSSIIITTQELWIHHHITFDGSSVTTPRVGFSILIILLLLREILF